MEHAGGVRRCVASICDKSLDIISMVETDVGSICYTGTRKKKTHEFVPIGLGQTAATKMTAMTIE